MTEREYLVVEAALDLMNADDGPTRKLLTLIQAAGWDETSRAYKALEFAVLRLEDERRKAGRG